MIEKRSVLNEISELIGEVLSSIGIIGIVAIIVCCLFAPVLAVFFESSLLRRNGQFVGLSELPSVNQKMKYIKVMLWIIAIASWTLLIGLGMNF